MKYVLILVVVAAVAVLFFFFVFNLPGSIISFVPLYLGESDFPKNGAWEWIISFCLGRMVKSYGRVINENKYLIKIIKIWYIGDNDSTSVSLIILSFFITKPGIPFDIHWALEKPDVETMSEIIERFTKT